MNPHSRFLLRCLFDSDCSLPSMFLTLRHQWTSSYHSAEQSTIWMCLLHTLMCLEFLTSHCQCWLTCLVSQQSCWRCSASFWVSPQTWASPHHWMSDQLLVPHVSAPQAWKHRHLYGSKWIMSWAWSSSPPAASCSWADEHQPGHCRTPSSDLSCLMSSITNLKVCTQPYWMIDASSYWPWIDMAISKLSLSQRLRWLFRSAFTWNLCIVN